MSNLTNSPSSKRLTRSRRKHRRQRKRLFITSEYLRNHQLEMLEDRRVLAAANTIVLDFTPDTISNEYQVGKFADVFDGSALNSSNKFLNYDASDNVIDADDARKAAKKIASKVRQLLKPYQSDVRVLYTPKVTQTFDPGAGEVRLAQGQSSDTENTYVIYVGDSNPNPALPDLGIAHQAFGGENNEFYGFVFAGAVKNMLASGNYRWKPKSKLTPIDFTNNVAFVIAHELGHLWGLGHLADEEKYPTIQRPDDYHHIMNYPKQGESGGREILERQNPSDGDR